VRSIPRWFGRIRHAHACVTNLRVSIGLAVKGPQEPTAHVRHVTQFNAGARNLRTGTHFSSYLVNQRMVNSMSPTWAQVTGHVDPGTHFSGYLVNQRMVNSMSPHVGASDRAC
jgi:hypothetical protein